MDTSRSMTIRPIGVVRSPFGAEAGTPIQPTFAAGAEGTVEVFEAYREGLADLEGFERVWLITWLDRAKPAVMRVRPYLDPVEHGLFATRAPARPNPIGLSCVRLVGVEGATLRIAELDLLDGTPVLDIKPYVPRFDRWTVQRYGWLEHVQETDGQADTRFSRTAKRDET